MKESKIAKAVSEAITKNKAKQGRPLKTPYEKLIFQTTKKLIDYQNSKKAFINKNSVKNKSKKQASKTRKQNSIQLQIAKNIIILKERLKKTTDVAIRQDLIDEIKRLKAHLSKLQHQIHHEDASRPLGKPLDADALVLCTDEHKFDISYAKLNKLEIEVGYDLTSKEQLEILASKMRDKKLGRKNNSEIENMDKTIRKTEKRRDILIENIKVSKVLNQPCMGRKKHGEEELIEINKLLETLHQKVAYLEEKMTEKELLQRHIRKLKNTRHSFIKKRSHVKKSQEIQNIIIEIKRIDQAISEKENELLELNNSKKQVKKIYKRNSMKAISRKLPKLKKSDHEFNLLRTRLEKALIENISLKSNLLKAVNDMNVQHKSA